VSIPNPVLVVFMRESFGYTSTATSVLVIPFEGGVLLFEHSYSCFYCLYEREFWMREHSYSCVYYSC